MSDDALHECSICGAAVSSRRKHDEWHRLLGKAAQQTRKGLDDVEALARRKAR